MSIMTNVDIKCSLYDYKICVFNQIKHNICDECNAYKHSFYFLVVIYNDSNKKEIKNMLEIEIFMYLLNHLLLGFCPFIYSKHHVQK
jgi:hypothetical protein